MKFNVHRVSLVVSLVMGSAMLVTGSFALVRYGLNGGVSANDKAVAVRHPQSHAKSHLTESPLDQYVEQASEFSSRARANVYFSNPQSLFNGVQVNFVNVGTGNLTFLRRDIVASGRIPIVVARVYDSSSLGSIDFGPGWRLSAAESIRLLDGKARLLSENGSPIDFVDASNNTFRLEKDYPSDYSALVKTAPDTFQASLRTGFTKEFKLIGDEFHLVSVTDRNANSVRLSYTNGLIAKIENLNHFVSFSRNKAGRVSVASDDQGRQVRYSYDKRGRLTEADDLGGHPWMYNYVADAKLKSALDPLQRVNFAVLFDDKNRVQRLQLPSGVIQYAYDPIGRMTTLIDRKQLSTKFFQNDDGITTRVINPLGEETSITLDSSRNVSLLSRNGSIVETMLYDNNHRLLSRRSTTDTGTVDRQYFYDRTSGLLAGIHPNYGGDLTFTYDLKGNLTGASLPDGLHGFTYSSIGDLTGFSAQSAKFAITSDPDGLIASMSDSANSVMSLQYKPGGELAGAAFPDRSQASYGYQPSGLRAGLAFKDGRRVDYSYDPAGNLTETKVFDAKGKQVNGQKLELNDSYQLVRWILFDGTVTSFQYDPNGNLTQIKKAKSLTRFEYDSLNRLTAVITPDGQRLTHIYNPGERSLLEQYEHAAIPVDDLRDTAFTFSGQFSTLASRPLTVPFASVRFSEPLASFQLANSDGSDIVQPHEIIEGALARLHLFSSGMSQKMILSGFNAPFNNMFIPPEYLSINCCPDCYYDSDQGWVCPPCGPPPPPANPPGEPDHLQVISDVTGIITNCMPPNFQNTHARRIVYQVMDSTETPLVGVFVLREQFGSKTANTCLTAVTTVETCTQLRGAFDDFLTVGCNAVGGSCGITYTGQQWQWCGSLLAFPRNIASVGDLVVHNDIITVNGTFLMFPGTDIFP